MIFIRDETSRVTSMDEPSFVHIPPPRLIIIVYLIMAAAELVRLGIDAVC